MNEVMQRVKKSSYLLSQLKDEVRNQILERLSRCLLEQKANILKENEKDLSHFPEAHPNYDRLKLTTHRLEEMANNLLNVAKLPSPLNQILFERQLPNGLMLKKISVPLGVIGVIYESRPNVTMDVFSLCFKAGNACILKGGKEAFYSNQALLKLIHQVLQEQAVSTDIVYLMSPEREAVYELLNAVDFVDVCIPRGSHSLIQFVRTHAKIPVIETGAGIVHTYFDLSGDCEKGMKIITNAKTRRVSVCNALDTLLIHQARLKELPMLVSELALKQVEIFADKESYAVLKEDYPVHLLKPAAETDFGQEFLSLKLSIKTVADVNEAIAHIMQYTSHHSEAIIAEEADTIAKFLNNVDAAVVYVNASTAFTDGAQFGLGAEIGISTQKLHARGPMGLEALTSYKWLACGNGQVRV